MATALPGEGANLQGSSCGHASGWNVRKSRVWAQLHKVCTPGRHPSDMFSLLCRCTPSTALWTPVLTLAN